MSCLWFVDTMQLREVGNVAVYLGKKRWLQRLNRCTVTDGCSSAIFPVTWNTLSFAVKGTAVILGSSCSRSDPMASAVVHRTRAVSQELTVRGGIQLFN